LSAEYSDQTNLTLLGTHNHTNFGELFFSVYCKKIRMEKIKIAKGCGRKDK
jgi:hypothetical protein